MVEMKVDRPAACLIWFRIAVVYFAVAVIIGIVMGASGDFSLVSVHAHMNLLGWEALALVGLIYHHLPNLGANRLAKTHFWLHNLGLPVMMLALIAKAWGNSRMEPLVGVASSVVFSDDVNEADTQGLVLTKHERYLWVADRNRNFIFVVDTETDAVVNSIPLAGGVSVDPTPELLVLSPNGGHVFMSLRGPSPLSSDPYVSMGSTPGVGVVKVFDEGRNGRFERVIGISNLDGGGVERADVHALSIRLK